MFQPENLEIEDHQKEKFCTYHIAEDLSPEDLLELQFKIRQKLFQMFVSKKKEAPLIDFIVQDEKDIISRNIIAPGYWKTKDIEKLEYIPLESQKTRLLRKVQ